MGDLWDNAGIIVATRQDGRDKILRGLTHRNKGMGGFQTNLADTTACDRCKHPVTMLDGTEKRARSNHPSVTRWRVVCVECREELRGLSER